MKLGYARVSTSDQSLESQTAELEQAGCRRIFAESESGGRWERPELQKLLEQLREEDVLVVSRLDRLTRSLSDLLRILKRVDDVGAGFCSLAESIDTTTPAGRMMAQMLGAFAEFERSIIRERTRAGVEAARKKGRVGGRRPKLSDAQRKHAIELYLDGMTHSEIASLFSVHRSTISRLVKHIGNIEPGDQQWEHTKKERRRSGKN
jgi:DNA invertase Pin-like site-specific DNA recombinase